MVVVGKSMLLLGAALAAIVLGSPADAGGGKHEHGYGQGWRDGGHHGQYGAWRGRGHDRHYRYSRHRGGLSGAEAGLIAAGIVGAAILIDSASDRRGTYDDRHDDRYARDPYGDDYHGGAYDRSDLYYRRDSRDLSADNWDDYADDRLDGELAGGGRHAASYNYGAAYNDCKAEARTAARDEGLTVGLPARPDRIERIGGGEAVRFVTQISLDEGRSDAFRQTMICEADADGVRFLELV